MLAGYTIIDALDGDDDETDETKEVIESVKAASVELSQTELDSQ